MAAQHGTTKYDWAKEIAGRLGLDVALIRPTTPSPGAKRPVRSWLRDLRLRELGIAPLRGLPAATEAFLAEAGLTQPG